MCGPRQNSSWARFWNGPPTVCFSVGLGNDDAGRSRSSRPRQGGVERCLLYRVGSLRPGLDWTGQDRAVSSGSMHAHLGPDSRQQAATALLPSLPCSRPAPALLLPCPLLLVGPTVSTRAMRQRQRPPSSKDDPGRPGVSCFFDPSTYPTLPRSSARPVPASVCGTARAQHRDGFVWHREGRPPTSPPKPGALEAHRAEASSRCTRATRHDEASSCKLTGSFARARPASWAQQRVPSSSPVQCRVTMRAPTLHHQPGLVRDGGG